MMGATLNSSSAAAKEMDMVLKSEIAAHSAYDPNARPTYHGVPLPGRKQVCISKHLTWNSPSRQRNPSSRFQNCNIFYWIL